MEKSIKDTFSNLVSRYDVANILEIKEASLRYFLYGKKPENMYEEFQIPKRQGGERKIAAPNRELRNIQRKLLAVLTEVYTPKVCAYGFIKAKNIKENADNHIKCSQILNIDLKNYFEQINFGRVRGMFIAKPYSIGTEAATVLAQIVCYKGKLPQGAPTSPIIANMVCAPMDNHFMKLARNEHITYTRYADDITFSSNHKFSKCVVLNDSENVIIGQSIIDILTEDGFEMNEKKIHLRNKGRRQEVTGLIVNKKVNVRREYVREVRAILHNYEQNGAEDAVVEYFKKYKSDEEYKNVQRIMDSENEDSKKAVINLFNSVLKGKINFIKDIRGNDDFVFYKYAEQLNHITGKKMISVEKHDQLMEKIENSVFILQADSGQGSGFLLKDYGLITNYHVTEDDYTYEVFSYLKNKITSLNNDINLVYEDNKIDYACYNFGKSSDNAWKRGDSDILVGKTMYDIELIMISYPDYLPGDLPNIQQIHIVGKRAFFDNDIFLIDGKIIHGASGGIVIDKNGLVMGVVRCGSATQEEAEQTIVQGFIPINTIVDDIKKKSF